MARGFQPLLGGAAALSAGLSVGLAQESNTASSLARKKFAADGRADETDSGSARALKHLRATGRGDETDSGFSLARKKLRLDGRADENDSAATLARLKQRAVAFAAELDSASQVAFTSQTILVDIGQADESDSALAEPVLLHALAAGRAVERDSAGASALVTIYPFAVSLALERNDAFSAYLAVWGGWHWQSLESWLAQREARRVYALELGLALERDEARALATSKRGAVQPALEVARARANRLAKHLWTGSVLSVQRAASLGILHRIGLGDPPPPSPSEAHAPRLQRVVGVRAASERSQVAGVFLRKHFRVGEASALMRAEALRLEACENAHKRDERELEELLLLEAA